MLATSKSISGFDPRSIPGCALWLDAADQSTITGSSPVTAWKDKSINGVTLSATGSPTVTTVNGLNSLSFNGSSYFSLNPYTKMSGATYAAWFAVANITNSSASYAGVVGTSFTANFYSQNQMYINSGSLMIYYRVRSSDTASNTSIPLNAGTGLLSTTTDFTAGTYQVFQNGKGGTLQTNGLTGTLDATQVSLLVGYSGYAGEAYIQGTISEILLYTRTLTTTQRQSIEGYLAWKWGIKSSLPATHPFYSLPAFSRPFGPTDIPGCALWLDAADLSTLSSVPIPTAYFPFDNSIVDQSNVITLTTTGSVPYVTGKFGQAVSFSNAAGVATSNRLSSTYALPSTFTASMWFQTPSTTPNSFIFYTNSNSTYVLGAACIYFSGGNLYCAYASVANNGTAYPISANTWYHVAITYNSGSLTLYVNGAQSGSTVTGTNSKNGFTLGGGADSGSLYPFTGYVDDLRIFTSVLTAAQISNIYTTTPPNNVAGWYDKSGNGNTMAGTATVLGSNMTFNGSTQAFSNTTFVFPSSNYSMFAVYSNTTAPASTAYMNVVYGSGGYPMVGVYDVNKYVSARSVVANTGALSPNVAASSTVLVSATYTPSTFSPFINGSVETTLAGTTLAATGIYVGGPTNYFNGSISEILIYSSNLSTTQRQQVEGYLAAKWGLLSSVVSGHPFKSIPPSTSQPPQFQEVTPGNWTYDWQPYLQRLAAANSGATASFSSSSVGGTAPGSYSGGVLAQNGKIYCMPGGSKTIGVIDTNTNTFSEPITTNITVIYSYTGGVLAPNGKIYCIPDSATNVGVIDPVANTFTTFGTAPGGTAYNGGVLAPNGLIYCIPCSATSIGIIDPVAGTFSTSVFPTGTVTGTGAGSFAYNAGVLGPNGNIYCIPRRATNIGLINPITGKFTTFGTTPGGNAFIGGVLAPNGKIYCIPFNATSVGVIDTTTNTYTTFGSVTNNFAGGVLGPNGNIYCMPYSSPYPIGVIDPVANTFTTFGAATSSGWGATLAPNGKIYCPTGGATTIGVISFSGLNQLPSSNYCLSAYTNKF